MLNNNLSKLKNFFKILLNISQALLIIFAGLIYYLSNEKMGVMRSLTYKNYVFSNFDLKRKMIYVGVAIVLLLVATSIRVYIKYKKSSYSLIVNVISVIVLGLMFKWNENIILAYYVLAIVALIVLFIEILKLNFLYKCSIRN